MQMHLDMNDFLHNGRFRLDAFRATVLYRCILDSNRMELLSQTDSLPAIWLDRLLKSK